MTSIREKIQDAASRNAELLSGLQATSSAPSQLAQQNAYIADLRHQLKTTEKRVSDLKGRTASELKDHKKYSESTFRRFAHKASGRKEKFEQKAEKEEREYFDAIQEQKTGEDNLAYVRHLLSEAETKKTELETQKQRHDALQRDLDALYNSIFGGYTPEFPDEDEKEQAYQRGSEYAQQASQTLEKTRHIHFLLREIGGKLREANMHLQNAHDMSSFDMFGGGTMSSMQKRNYLERAESAISQVRMLQQQVQQIDPRMADLGPMNIASGSIWGDVVFDNIFSDMEMHNKIKDSEAQLGRAMGVLQRKIKEVEDGEQHSRTEAKRAGEGMEEARVELQKARERAFERVERGEGAGGMGQQMGGQEAPPAYSG